MIKGSFHKYFQAVVRVVKVHVIMAVIISTGAQTKDTRSEYG